MIKRIPEQAGDLLSTATDDGTVIVSTDDGTLSVVNEVGAFVWESIDGRSSVEDIVQRVTEYFDVTHAAAQADVLAFVHALADRGLVTMKEPS